MFQPDLLSSGDVILVALPGHIPRRHEQQGNRPVIVMGLPWGEVRYPMLSTYTKLIVYFIIRLIGRANAIRPYTNKVSLRRLKKFNPRRRVLSV